MGLKSPSSQINELGVFKKTRIVFYTRVQSKRFKASVKVDARDEAQRVESILRKTIAYFGLVLYTMLYITLYLKSTLYGTKSR